jgi:hypothetical protein
MHVEDLWERTQVDRRIIFASVKNSVAIGVLGGLLEQGQDLEDACLPRAIRSKESSEAAQAQVTCVLP